MFLLLLLGAVIILFYFIKKKFSYWEKLGVPGPKPLLLVGNIGENIIGKKPLSEVCADIYRDYEDYAVVGVYRATTPCLLVRDVEIIKNVLVKDFKYFSNNDVAVEKDVDPLIGRNPFVLKGEEWKTTRSQLAPNFSSGKMKSLMPLLEEVSKRMVQYIKKLENKNDIDAKEICTKFTCDNVAACAFGMEGNCFTEDKSEFRHLANKFINPASWQTMIFFLLTIVPTLTKFIKLKVAPKDVEERLIDIVDSNLKYRKDNNVVRHDFLDSMKQISESTPSFTTIDIAAHAASFFLDGFETSSIVMSFVLFDLAMNQDYQSKLRDEINSVIANHNGKVCYEAIQEMLLLEACISETLRIHTVVGVLSKVCTQDYTITGNNGTEHLSITVKPGMTILVPVAGLHSDPKHFPEPKRYYPERFMNKENKNKYIYMPFGDGPRVCIGQRFGLLQVKAGVIHIIRNFEISVSKKMKLPIKYSPFYIASYPRGGFWLNFREI